MGAALHWCFSQWQWQLVVGRLITYIPTVARRTPKPEVCARLELTGLYTIDRPDYKKSYQHTSKHVAIVARCSCRAGVSHELGASSARPFCINSSLLLGA